MDAISIFTTMTLVLIMIFCVIAYKIGKDLEVIANDIKKFVDRL